MNNHRTYISVTILILMVIWSFGCTPKRPILPEETPVGIITKDSMIMIMTDCFIVEGATKQIQVQHKNVLLHTNVFYNMVFDKYRITFNEYKSSLEYYHQYPKTAEEMYEQAIQNLSKIESENNIKKKTETD